MTIPRVLVIGEGAKPDVRHVMRHVRLATAVAICATVCGCAAPSPSAEDGVRYCPVHNLELRKETVHITYGLPIFEDGYDEDGPLFFPYDNSVVLGGCVHSPDSPRAAAVRFCPGCRKAAEAWVRRARVRSRAQEEAVLRAYMATSPDINKEEPFYGHSLLIEAAQRGFPEVVRDLIEMGADVNGRDNGTGFTPLERELWRAQSYSAKELTPSYIEVLNAIIDAGAKVNAPDARGDTPLHLAAGGPSLSAVLLLLDHGAEINARNADGLTPLAAAEAAGGGSNREIIERLKKRGAVK